MFGSWECEIGVLPNKVPLGEVEGDILEAVKVSLGEEEAVKSRNRVKQKELKSHRAKQKEKVPLSEAEGDGREVLLGEALVEI